MEPTMTQAAQLRREMGLLSEDELAAMLGVEIKTIRNWRTERSGPPPIKAGSILYRRRAVRQWLQAREAAGNGWPPSPP